MEECVSDYLAVHAFKNVLSLQWYVLAAKVRFLWYVGDGCRMRAVRGLSFGGWGGANKEECGDCRKCRKRGGDDFFHLSDGQLRLLSV